jgi:hypothetical protein
MGHNLGNYPQVMHRAIPAENTTIPGETGLFVEKQGYFWRSEPKAIGRWPEPGAPVEGHAAPRNVGVDFSMHVIGRRQSASSNFHPIIRDAPSSHSDAYSERQGRHEQKHKRKLAQLLCSANQTRTLRKRARPAESENAVVLT